MAIIFEWIHMLSCEANKSLGNRKDPKTEALLGSTGWSLWFSVEISLQK